MTDTEVLESPSAAPDRWRWLAASFAVVAVAALAFAAFVLVRDDDRLSRADMPGTMPMMSMDIDAMRDQCMAMHDDADWCAQMTELMAEHPGGSMMPMMRQP